MDTELTGISGLDCVSGGLPPSGVTMLVGTPGTGKTVMALQIATHAVHEGRDVVFFSAYSEPHEKVIAHMQDFAFFEPPMIGKQIELLSLKSVIQSGGEETLSAILRTIRSKRQPLIIIDGYQGLRHVVGPLHAQELLAGISSQMPYHRASCIIASEAEPTDAEQYSELATADAIIALSNKTIGTAAIRRIELLKMRGHAYREGSHSLQITSDGIQVFPRPATWQFPDEHGSDTARKRFGLVEFDRMLGGGLPDLSTTVFYGDPGTGKTTFGLNYLLAGVAAEERGLLLTFREPVAGLYRKAADLGLDLEGVVRSGMVQIQRVAPVEIDPDEVAWTMRTIIEQHNVRRVVIDGLVELERAVRLRSATNDYLAALTEYLWRADVTPLLLQDGGIISAADFAAGYPSTFALAQNRVLLRRVEYEAHLYRICTVLTMQTSDHDTSVREFTIGQGGITILDPGRSRPGVLTGITREQRIRDV